MIYVIYLKFIPLHVTTQKALLSAYLVAKRFARNTECFTLFSKANFLNSLTAKILFGTDLDIVLLS